MKKQSAFFKTGLAFSDYFWGCTRKELTPIWPNWALIDSDLRSLTSYYLTLAN